MEFLLAVDVGVKTGLALYGRDGRLRRHLSRNLGSAARLRRAIPALLAEMGEVGVLVLEGGGPLADAWAREAGRRGIRVLPTVAERWREGMLVPSRRRDGRSAKRSARDLARRVIEWSGATQTKKLKTDAAEAILVGLWGVVRVGWVDRLPTEVVGS